MTAIETLKRQFVKTLEGISHKQKPYESFRDWLELSAITLHQLPFHVGDFPKDEVFNGYEEKYLSVAKRYTREQLEQFSQLLGITVAALQQYPSDFLGEIASENGFINPKAGQFFTPYHLSRAIAKMQMGNVREYVEQKGIITISDPACGAGGMLIAATEEIIYQKIDPRQVVQFEAIDIDRDCFNMTYIQMSALDLQAVVRHGNTLSWDFWESCPTPQLRYFEQWLEQRRDIERDRQRWEMLRELLTAPATLGGDEEQKPLEAPIEEGTGQETGNPEDTRPLPSSPMKTTKADVVIDHQQLNLFNLQDFSQD